MNTHAIHIFGRIVSRYRPEISFAEMVVSESKFQGDERSQLGEFSWQLGEPLWHLLSGVGRDKFERAVIDQHYAEILLLIISVTGGESEALHEWIYISPYSCAVKDTS